LTSKTPTVPAGKRAAGRFLRKAEEFLRSARRAHGEGEPNAAGMLAIHAGISACDALTAHFLGVRSNSARHHDVLNLVRTLPISQKGRFERQMRRLLDAKSTVEYDDEVMVEGDEDKMVEAAERIVRTARDSLR
jgi:HEPN domain-containing protein